MSCSCGTVSEGKTSGCQNNGGCATGGCNKLNVFDWLSGMDIPTHQQNDLVEVRFKNGRKEFFRNVDNLDIVTGEAIVVDVPGGHHLGYVSLQGELVRLQMKKKKVADDDQIRRIYRKATLNDIEKAHEVRKREMPALYRTRQIIEELGLQMKLTDIEFQSDDSKATFYYSANDRVDFRTLIKRLASEFRIRVEMRQISIRQEAGRLGGIGSCGRELCCSTWLTDFKSVSTSAARYQNLSLNPSKLSGQCGRLKCCLNYELDTYLEYLEDIPKVNKLKTKVGLAKLQKTDIFRKIMWFNYGDENQWHAVSISRVKEILAMNKAGSEPESLAENEIVVIETKINSDLDKMDQKFRKKDAKKRVKRNKKRKGNPAMKGGNDSQAKKKKPFRPKKNKNTPPRQQPGKDE